MELTITEIVRANPNMSAQVLATAAGTTPEGIRAARWRVCNPDRERESARRRYLRSVGRDGPHPIRLFWTAERDKRLRSMWGKVSTTEIAGELGTTKNAVIGRANRIGLPRLK